MSAVNSLQSGVHTRLARAGSSCRWHKLCTNAWKRALGSVLGRGAGTSARTRSDEKSAIRRARKGQVGFKSGVKERRLSSGSGGVFMQVPQPNPSRVETRVGLGSGSRCWYECSDSER